MTVLSSCQQRLLIYVNYRHLLVILLQLFAVVQMQHQNLKDEVVTTWLCQSGHCWSVCIGSAMVLICHVCALCHVRNAGVSVFTSWYADCNSILVM